jgi:UDP-glucose 4-epimerase
VKVLIAGGAGYIGSTIASACLDAGITPVIIDNLETGRREFTADRIFYEGDIEDRGVIDEVFREHPDIYAVVLCAALINVPDSVMDPIAYYMDNVSKSLSLASHLIRNGCDRLIFSSSASIYGSGEMSEVDEDSVIQPLSPYARTKAICESMFEDIANAESLRVLSLRYFNPIGADPKMRTGLQLPHPGHALGKMIEAMEADTPFEITGTDYPTRDGTGIRDYVHVWDLADAHLLSLRRFDNILSSEKKYEAINLGTGCGTTVRELLDAFNQVMQTPVEAVEAIRRPGDTAGAYASNDKAKRLLGWKPNFSLVDGIRDSLRWSEVRRDVLGG